MLDEGVEPLVTSKPVEVCRFSPNIRKSPNYAASIGVDFDESDCPNPSKEYIAEKFN